MSLFRPGNITNICFKLLVFLIKQSHRKLDYHEASIISYWRVAQHWGEQSTHTHSDAELEGMKDDPRTESKPTKEHNASTEDIMKKNIEGSQTEATQHFTPPQEQSLTLKRRMKKLHEGEIV